MPLIFVITIFIAKMLNCEYLICLQKRLNPFLGISIIKKPNEILFYIKIMLFNSNKNSNIQRIMKFREP